MVDLCTGVMEEREKKTDNLFPKDLNATLSGFVAAEEHEQKTDFCNAKVAGFFLSAVLLVPAFGGSVRYGGQEFVDFWFEQRWKASQRRTRFRMVLSMVMDFLANEVYKLLLFFTLPLLLAPSATFIDFVKDAFAMTFIVQLDDCEAEDGVGVDEDYDFLRDDETGEELLRNPETNVFENQEEIWIREGIERRDGSESSLLKESAA
ncbi:unnamed protein product [Polarella glacialis]|uniref:Uncharacterized protein n=1 Tax=Polarella glacialis TaxID=89957 RepID=A0A813E8T5_POLGL|nr:unnamed protein product [Polarella glacialis]